MVETVSFSKLIEYSFPEIGSVNFNQLQYLLVALLKHLQLNDDQFASDGMAKEKDQSAQRMSRNSFTFLKLAENNEDGEKREERDSQNLKSEKTDSKRKIEGQSLETDKDAKTVEKLEKKVSDMERKLKSMEASSWSNDEESQSNSREATNTPFSDWRTLTKRIEANEESLKMFASALEQLSQEVREMRGDMRGKSSKMDEAIQYGQSSEERSSFQEPNDKLADSLEKTYQKVAEMKKEIDDLTAQQNDILRFKESFPMESSSDVLADLSYLKSWVNKMETKLQPDILQEKIENQTKEHTEKLNELNKNLINLSNTFGGQIKDIENELGTLNERFNTGGAKIGWINDEEGLGPLYSKLQELEEEIQRLKDTTTVLISEQKEREGNINGLREQMQLIKNIKADKEGLEDALAEKADAFSVNRKVSQEQFDAAYFELNQSIIDIQARLGDQEQAWISAISNVQKDIGEKLDKMEIVPLQEEINNRIKELEDKVKALAEKKEDTKACGTKKKLIRNINCISCDKKVAMKTELDGSQLPVLDKITPTKSMRPFLTYELDQIRRDIKSPHCSNANDFGNADFKTEKLQSETQGGGQYCSRYCGGSNTIITKKQRMRKTGHFLDNELTDENTKGRSEKRRPNQQNLL